MRRAFLLTAASVLATAASVAQTAAADAERTAVNAMLSLVEDGGRAFKSGNRAVGRQQLEQAAKLAGSDIRRLRILGSALVDAQINELAVQVCQQSFSISPNDPVLHGILGIAQQRLKKYPEAIRHLSAAVRLQPNETRWLIALARTHIYTSEEPKALEEIDRALTLSPSSVEALEVRAECEYRHRRNESCEATCRSILKSTPKSRLAWQLLIRVVRAQNREKEAVELCEKARRELGEDGEILIEWGIALLSMNDARGAVEKLEAAQARLPGDARPPLHLCRAYTRSGMADKAAAARERWEAITAEAKASESRPQ